MPWCSQHAETIKDTSHSWVGYVEIDGTPVCLKVFRAQGPLQQFAARLGRHRALRSFAAAGHLLKADLPVPQPIACLQVGADMLLVTERLPEGEDLLALWQSQGEQLPAMIWREAGVLMGQLHRAGFVHGDCKWSNIYRAQDSHYLLDLEAVARVGAGAALQFRDVARFVLNAEDMGASQRILLAFLSAYASEVDSTIDEVSVATLGYLKRLRLRHERKYGKRGHILLQG